ncbi:Hypothetical protein R9X50_00033800 [Acrodontium crateriforme]|uniref:Short chain dehydrogenase n=1 Tax=Acrodontium crateriforme TaxID=150365 RepID=A0AAQ3LXW2_9PEZI|nr:Hypothetical protein R9X50_00033800 [Acrodontium crateriforme]
MARILITGSSDGIGQAAAKLLADQGHKVTLHARNASRASEAKAAVPKAEGVLIGDLTNIADVKELAKKANDSGPWDAVVHNAGLGPSSSIGKTADGIGSTFAVNTLAPYILTCLMNKPKRLLYLSSSMHSSGDGSLKDLTWSNRTWDPYQAYCDSKLHDTMLANVVARYWPDVQSCSLDPGWISTKMGGANAPGVVATPSKAIGDYAVGNSGLTGDRTGVYFNPQALKTPHSAANDEKKQEQLLKICEELSGVSFSA